MGQLDFEYGWNSPEWKDYQHDQRRNRLTESESPYPITNQQTTTNQNTEKTSTRNTETPHSSMGSTELDQKVLPVENFTGDCLGAIYCERCRKFHGYCSEVTNVLNGILNGFFNQPTTADDFPNWQKEQQQTMDLASHRSKDSGKGKFVRRDFLKAKDIPARGGMKAKILDFRTAPKAMEYSDFLMDISAGKKEYVIGLKSQSVLLDMLQDELGSKTEKWIGKTITLIRGGNKGQYINVG